MATLPAPQSGRLPFTLKPRAPKPRTRLPFTVLAAEDDKTETDSPSEPARAADSDPFESRLSQVRLRYRSGTGKKAELRKSKKGVSKTGSGIFLPPVALKEPVSDGLKVEFGFSPYSERVNGRIAMLGLSALLLVELATGKSVINYHTPSIVFIQVYFVAAVAALQTREKR